MASVVDEIAIKLGVQAGDLKAALSDADASVQKFGASGAHGVAGLTGAIHETHSAMRTFHQFMVGGGIVEAVKGFFELAIKGAEASKNATDENAAAVLRFRDAAKGGWGDFATGAMNAVGFVNRLGEDFGSALRYAKEYWAAQITGNKANMDAFDQAEASELAANAAQERLAKVRKESGAELKQLAQEINAEHQKTIDKLREAEPLQQQVADLTKDVAKQQDIIASSETNAVDRQKARLAIAKDENELIRVNAELKKQSDAEFIKRNAAEDEARLKGLTNEQKIKELTSDIGIGEQLITTLKQQGADTTIVQAQLDERRSLLAKSIGDQEAQSLARKKQIAGSASEELELLALQQKAILGIATGPEQQRLKVIQLQRQERAIELQMEDLAQKAITGTLTPADQARLKVLEDQKTKLDESLAIILKMMNLPPTPPPPIAAAVKSLISLNEQFEEFEGKISNSGDVQNLSDIQLDALIQKIQRQLPTMIQSDQMNKSVFDLTNGETVETAALKSNLNAALKEQSLRTNFRYDVNTLGQNYVEGSTAPADFQRLIQYINPDGQKQQQQNIATITTTLTNLFPDQAKGIRNGGT